MKNKSKVLAIILALAMLLGTVSLGTDQANAGVVKKIEKSYDIAVVFDNSGSMYKSDAWCKAKYAMEVFAALMPYDPKNPGMNSLRIYPMWEVGKKGDKTGSYEPIDIASSDDIQKIHDMYTIDNGDTPFAPVREAYKDLQGSSADEKWLVVLTDGAFNLDGREGKPKDGIVNVQKELEKYADGNINVQYLALGEETADVTPDKSRGLYAAKATNESLSKDLISICNRIFKRAKLPDKYFSDNNKLDLPLSMNNVVVFAQGKGAKVKGLEGTKGDVEVKEETKCQFSDVSTGGKNSKKAVVDKSLYGQVVRFGPCTKGKYKLNLKNVDHDNVQIFYEPDVDIKVTLTDPKKNDDKGQELTNTESFKTGKYNIDYKLIDNKTDEDVSESELLAPVTYDGQLVYSDGTKEKLNPGDPFTLKPDGEAFVDVTATYLEDYQITTGSPEKRRDAYTIKVDKAAAKKLKMELDVQQKFLWWHWYQLKKIHEWKPIRANLKYDGKPMTDEQLKQVKIDGDFGGKNVPYYVEPVPGESAVDIYLGKTGPGSNDYKNPDTGKYKAPITASYTEQYHKASKTTETAKFRISEMGIIPWILSWLIPLILLLLFIAWLLFHKTFPKKVYFNDRRGASKIKVRNKGVNLSSNAYPSELVCDADRVTRFIGRGKRTAKFAIKNLRPDPSVQSFSIGAGKEYVKDGTGQFVDTMSGSPLSSKTKITIRNGTEITWRKNNKRRTGTITINTRRR